MSTKVSERKSRDGDGLREKILDAARELFVEKGYENVSMRKVAEKIAYSPTTIYLYFRDKADLFNCLCEEMYARLAEIPASLPEANGDPIEFLRKVLLTYVNMGLTYPNQYRVAFLLSSNNEMTAEDYLPPKSEALHAYNAFRCAVSECVKQGRFRDVDVDAACQVLWSAVHGLTSLLILFPTFPWAEKDTVVELTVNSVIRGFMKNAM